MKQQINLYQVEKQKFVLNFTFNYALSALALFVFVLGSITAYDVVNYYHIKKEFQKLDKEHTEKERKLQSISKQVPEERTRNQLVADIKNLENEKKEKINVISLLLSEGNSKSTGFSVYLDFLANHTVQGVWLTELNFKDNGSDLVMRGKAVNAGDVPILITSLSSGSAFKGKTFETFKVEADHTLKYVDFVLQTKKDTGSKGHEAGNKQ